MRDKSLYKIKVKHMDSTVVEVEAENEIEAQGLAINTILKKNKLKPDNVICSVDVVDDETIDYDKTISESDYKFDVHVNVVRKPMVVHLEVSIKRENAMPETFKIGWTCGRDESHEARVRSEVAEFIGNFVHRKM